MLQHCLLRKNSLSIELSLFLCQKLVTLFVWFSFCIFSILFLLIYIFIISWTSCSFNHNIITVRLKIRQYESSNFVLFLKVLGILIFHTHFGIILLISTEQIDVISWYWICRSIYRNSKYLNNIESSNSWLPIFFLN